MSTFLKIPIPNPLSNSCPKNSCHALSTVLLKPVNPSRNKTASFSYGENLWRGRRLSVLGREGFLQPRPGQQMYWSSFWHTGLFPSRISRCSRGARSSELPCMLCRHLLPFVLPFVFLTAEGRSAGWELYSQSAWCFGEAWTDLYVP